MGKYKINRKTRRYRFVRFLAAIALLLVVLVAVTIFIRHIYFKNLQPENNSPKSQIVDIASGLSVKQIADLLHNDHVIRNAWAFEWYVRSSSLHSNLQAGTYALSPDQTVQQVVNTLTQGKITTKLVTILPDQRIDQIRSQLINDGFSPAAVDNALNPQTYSDLQILAVKPANVSLEGLLYPDSFQRVADTDPSVIVRESLVEMGQHLTPELQAAFARQSLSPYQGIILASIVEKEVSDPTDQAQVAQVFLKRLSLGMPLGSDVTVYYGAIVAGQPPSLSYDSPYNTHLHTGLPPTPISNVTDQALNAVANPASTSWLYFVTGDDGTTRFADTLQQHQANVAQFCHQKCAQTAQ